MTAAKFLFILNTVFCAVAATMLLLRHEPVLIFPVVVCGFCAAFFCMVAAAESAQ